MLLCCCCLGFGGCFAHRLLGKTGAYAPRANICAFGRTVVNGADFLNVWLPDFFGFIVGMTYLVSNLTAFAANTAYA